MKPRRYTDNEFNNDLRYGGSYWADIAKEFDDGVRRSIHLINQAGPPRTR